MLASEAERLKKNTAYPIVYMSETWSITSKDTKHTINCVEVDGAKWYRGKDVATQYGYHYTKQAICNHVVSANTSKFDRIAAHRAI